jgi:tetratricopeptide repeat protein
VQILWANMHGGFVLGILLLGVFAAGEAIAWARARYLWGDLEGGRDDLIEPPPAPLLRKEGETRRMPAQHCPLLTKEGVRGRSVSTADLLLLLSLPLLAVAASLINPYGVRLLAFPFELTGMDVFMQQVYEWGSPFEPPYNISYPFYGYWLWLTLLFGSFFLVRGPVPDSRSWRGVLRAVDAVALAGFVLFCYAFMWWPEILLSYRWWWVAAGVLFAAANLVRLDATEVGIVALMFALSLRHNRGVADAVIATFPVLTRNLSSILERFALLQTIYPSRDPSPIRGGTEDRQAARGNAKDSPFPPQEGGQGVRSGRGAIEALRIGGSNPFVVVALSLALLAGAGFVQLHGYRYRAGQSRQQGFGIAQSLPVCAIRYIGRRGLSGNAFTSYDVAALLIYQGYPHVKVNMDSRNDVYGPDLFAEYQASRVSLDAMIDYLAKYHVDFFLMGQDDLATDIWQYLLRSGEWVQVFFDDQCVVLVRNSPQFASVIATDEYRVLLPSMRRNQPLSADNAEAYLREATRASETCPSAWLPHWYRVEALMALQRLPEALADALVVVQRNPRAWFAWSALGDLYHKLHDRPRAIVAYQKALELNPTYLPARMGLTFLEMR